MPQQTRDSSEFNPETTAAIVKVEPGMIPGSHWKGIDNEALASFVIEGVRAARITAMAVLELRKRFTKLSGNATIHGYRKGEWSKFCVECLGMTDSNARKMIQRTGMPNPAAKHDGSANRKPTLVPTAEPQITIPTISNREQARQNYKAARPEFVNEKNSTVDKAIQKEIQANWVPTTDRPNPARREVEEMTLDEYMEALLEVELEALARRLSTEVTTAPVPGKKFIYGDNGMDKRKGKEVAEHFQQEVEDKIPEVYRAIITVTQRLLDASPPA